ncbi:MAG: protocatechuate 3,4-dioxygenase subunit alpha [Thermomicrobiaceae bacterium]
MKQKPRLTPSQTVGPFFHPTLLRADSHVDDLLPAGYPGTPIVIHGYVYDGASEPVPDAAIEIWQADEEGEYLTGELFEQISRGSEFTGYGRVGTDDTGRFQIRTVKPGPVPFDNSRHQAPHICVTVYARGLLNHIVTRIYFEGDPLNDEDPILQRVPDHRRETLIATRTQDGTYRFDIVLQGERETVFFNV